MDLPQDIAESIFLNAYETIIQFWSGNYFQDSGKGYIVLTNQRVIFLKDFGVFKTNMKVDEKINLETINNLKVEQDAIQIENRFFFCGSKNATTIFQYVMTERNSRVLKIEKDNKNVEQLQYLTQINSSSQSNPNQQYVHIQIAKLGDDISIIKDSVVQRCNIGGTVHSPDLLSFEMCPFCGKELNLPKSPKYCPYCKEQFRH